MVLPSCEMTIDEANRRIINHKPRNDPSLHISAHALQRPQYHRTLLPYLPPIPRLIVAIATSLSAVLSEFFTNMHVNSPARLSVYITVYPSARAFTSRTSRSCHRW